MGATIDILVLAEQSLGTQRCLETNIRQKIERVARPALIFDLFRPPPIIPAALARWGIFRGKTGMRRQWTVSVRRPASCDVPKSS